MTYIVSSGALNSTHSLTSPLYQKKLQSQNDRPAVQCMFNFLPSDRRLKTRLSIRRFPCSYQQTTDIYGWSMFEHCRRPFSDICQATVPNKTLMYHRSDIICRDTSLEPEKTKGKVGPAASKSDYADSYQAPRGLPCPQNEFSAHPPAIITKLRLSAHKKDIKHAALP